LLAVHTAIIVELIAGAVALVSIVITVVAANNAQSRRAELAAAVDAETRRAEHNALALSLGEHRENMADALAENHRVHNELGRVLTELGRDVSRLEGRTGAIDNPPPPAK
jgi:hypothetical protein